MEKICNTKRLIDLLRERVKSVEASIAMSKRSCVELQEAAHAKKAALQLAESRLDLRHRERPKPELKRDDFEVALGEEKEMLLNSQKRLNEQARRTDLITQDLVRHHAELLEDLKAKTHALHIDQDCVQTASTMGRHTFHPTCEADVSQPTTNLPVSVSYTNHPVEQEAARQVETMNRVRRAKKREEEANKLREESEQLSKQTEQQCIAANSITNDKMNRNIAELQEVMKRLKGTVRDHENRIAQTYDVLSRTADEMSSHEDPFALANTRRALRNQRMPQENIHDPVKSALDKQVSGMQKNLHALDDRHEQEKKALAGLQQGIAAMKADLISKQKALDVDLQCRNTLKVYDMSAYQSDSMKAASMKKTLASLGASAALNAKSGRPLADLKIGTYANRYKPPPNVPRAAMTAR